MAVTPQTPYCPGVDLGDDLRCANCGRACAQYRSKLTGQITWMHRRGASVGATETLRQAQHAAEARADRAERRMAEINALVGDAHRLDRIEAKLDELLRRPVGMVEWRPDHRRMADGGRAVNEQRDAAGVRRPVRVRKRLDGMAG